MKDEERRMKSKSGSSPGSPVISRAGQLTNLRESMDAERNSSKRNSMKTLLSSVAIIFFASVAVSSAAGEKDAMIDKEKAVWQTVQDKKFDAFRKYFAD